MLSPCGRVNHLQQPRVVRHAQLQLPAGVHHHQGQDQELAAVQVDKGPTRS